MGVSLSVKGKKIKFDLTEHEIKAYDSMYSVPNSKYAKKLFKIFHKAKKYGIIQ